MREQERDGWRDVSGKGGKGPECFLLIRGVPGGSGPPGEARSACLCSCVFTIRKASSSAALRTLSNLSFQIPACRPRLSLPALMARKESHRLRHRTVISAAIFRTSCNAGSPCMHMGEQQLMENQT